MSIALKWTVRQGAELLWRSWDRDEVLVFDVASGDTHLVNQLTAEILKLLDRVPLDVAGVCRELGDSGEDCGSEESRTVVTKLLVYLDQLGVVEPYA